MDRSTWFVYTMVVVLHLWLCVVGKDEDPMVKSCSKMSSCKCKTPNLGYIDLEPLCKGDGTPRFDNLKFGAQQYSWNPCKPFSLGDCKKVAVCQKATYDQYYNLGTQDTAHFEVDDKYGLQIVYTANSWRSNLKVGLETPSLQNPWGWERPRANVSVTFTRTSYVRLVCDLNSKPGTLTTSGEDKSWSGRYYFTLTSYYACPSYLHPKPESSSGSLSTGSCLLIVVFVMLAFYLVVGSAMQVFIYKRSGTDAIPNKTFWVSLPGLVKDGTIFVIKGRRTTGYSEV